MDGTGELRDLEGDRAVGAGCAEGPGRLRRRLRYRLPIHAGTAGREKSRLAAIGKRRRANNRPTSRPARIRLETRRVLACRKECGTRTSRGRMSAFDPRHQVISLDAPCSAVVLTATAKMLSREIRNGYEISCSLAEKANHLTFGCDLPAA
jgi:hypothetical protein